MIYYQIKQEEISIEKQEIEDYNKQVKVSKKFEKLEDLKKLDDDEVSLLSTWGFHDPEMIPKPRYEFPPIIVLVLDDLTGNHECFKRGSTISNIIETNKCFLCINLKH